MVLNVFAPDDALKGIKDPRDYRHMKVLRFSLRSIGGWPGRDLNENPSRFAMVPNFCIIISFTLAIILGIFYLNDNNESISFLQKGHVFVTMSMSIISIVRGLTLPLNSKYRNLVKKYITKMHLLHYKDKSEYAMKMHLKVHKISHFFTMWLKFQIIAGVFFFNFAPIYKNYSSGKFNTKELFNETYELAIYMKLPNSALTTIKGYMGPLAFGWFGAYYCCNFFCMYDLFLFLMLFNVTSHFKILMHKLESIPTPAETSSSSECSNVSNGIFKRSHLYSPIEMKEVSKSLKECIDYHREIIKFTGEISEAFGPMLLSYYMFHQIVLCILLLECSTMDPEALMCFGIVTVVLFQQLAQLSFVVESVGTITGKIKDVVYNVPWEHMDTSNRKIVAIFLMNVQEPFHIVALGIAKVGVEPMATILKTSLSYYAFLRNISH